MKQEILVIKSVSKKYRLGMIGGTTLRDELQRKKAMRKGLEDPTKKVLDLQKGNVGEEFLALSNINITIYQGERVGIIGHNGAGKSTLLKLISRITAPSEGTIEINGRITSMLEVGTGFHPELTGRENIYMNGAILGMKKAEIDSKIEEIIEFSECRQFIDTPVKRYSSGMYVKLAFSVAAHLNSEIMIMDEVLAVGDMAFQRKCLEKMNSVSRSEGRTILYVSHNMNTIRQLCDRVIVLEHGQKKYDGNTEDAINVYLGRENDYVNTIEVTEELHEELIPNSPTIEAIRLNNKDGLMNFGTNMHFTIRIHNRGIKDYGFYIRIIMRTISGNIVTMAYSENRIIMKANETKNHDIFMDTSQIVPGQYTFTFVLFDIGEMNADLNLDVLRDIVGITIIASPDFNHGMSWNSSWWGNFFSAPLHIAEED